MDIGSQQKKLSSRWIKDEFCRLKGVINIYGKGVPFPYLNVAMNAGAIDPY